MIIQLSKIFIFGDKSNFSYVNHCWQLKVQNAEHSLKEGTSNTTFTDFDFKKYCANLDTKHIPVHEEKTEGILL